MNTFAYRITDSLELRLFEMHHAVELFNLANANRAHLAEFLPWIDDIQTLSDAQAYIQQGLRQFSANDGFQAGIWLDDALIGSIGHHSIDWNNRKTELGYWLDKSHLRRGYMMLSLEAIIQHCFETYQLNRIQLRIAVNNTRSRILAERLHFKLEGVLRQDVLIRGQYVDHALYALLAQEWWDSPLLVPREK